MAISPENANDVSKALAAFGAPSIRYHSFGQGQVKPSSVVMPRREVAPPVIVPTLTVAPAPPPMPAPSPYTVPVAPPLLRQPSGSEAGVVFETRVTETRVTPVQPMPQMAPQMPTAPMPPVPAFRRTVEAAAPPVRSAPMPPPRPLSERSIAPATRLMPETPRVTNEFVSPAASFGNPAPTPVPSIPEPPASDYYRRSSEVAPPAPLPLPSFEPSATQAGAGTGASAVARMHTLKEIFAFLAAGPGSGPGAPSSFGRGDTAAR